MESNTSKLNAYLRAGLESGGVGENGRKRVRLGSDLRTSVFGGVMFGVVEEISLCGRKKKNGEQFLADYSPLGNVAWRVDRPKTRNRDF